MPPVKKPAPSPLSPEAALSGILAVLVARLEADGVTLDRKIELVLHDAGLRPEDIASVTGKSLAAVRKTIQRGRSA
jgi:DNA-directed RNA polymerase specialized sigma24 family protein